MSRHLLSWLLCLCLMASYTVLANNSPPREVVVGVYQNPPKLTIADNGSPSGIFGDLLKEIARQQQWHLKTVVCDWAYCLRLLQSGDIDLLPDMALTEERAGLFHFHQTAVLFSWSQFFHQPQHSFSQLSDLTDKRIAVLDHSVQHSYLQHQLAAQQLKVSLIAAPSVAEAFTLVALGKADAIATNHYFGQQQARFYGLEPSPWRFLPTELYFASASGRNADLLSAIDQQLNDWQARPDSVYYQIIQRWTAPTAIIWYQSRWWWLLPLGLLLTPFLSWWWLRRRYQHRLSRLQASEQQLTTLLNTVDAFIYIKDLKLRYQYVNPKVAQLFQRKAEQIIGHTDFLFFDSKTAAILQVNDQRVLQGGERIVEEEPLTTADGKQQLTCLVVKMPLRDAKGNIYALCGIATDISEHKQSQAAIHHLAFYDALTELPNRRLFLERLAQAHQLACRLPQTGAVLFIDLDHFKDLNDTLGHAVGDELLQQVAKRLAEQLRKTDTLARFGGDEFVVLVTDLQAKSELASQRVEMLANKLLHCLISDFTLAERQYSISASIGIAMFDDAASVDELLQRADLAMYDAKNRGRNQLCFFNQQMQAQASERTQLLAGLRQALNEQQFFLHLQGQYDNQGQLLGAEVLLRWQYAEHGLVSPADFIPLAENSGLIISIGNWVLRQSCEILAQWRYMTQRQHWHLAVNISVRQLQATNFVSTVADILQSTGADGANLVLELTESQLLEDVEQVINTMQQLRQLGVQFSLDDFGTGYSSLSYLKRLPLSQLKIDRSFVRDILIDSNDEAIVKTILALGDALELQVIAEGVESAAQHQALTLLGCQQFQGYYFARPGLLQDLQAQWQPSLGPERQSV